MHLHGMQLNWLILREDVSLLKYEIARLQVEIEMNRIEHIEIRKGSKHVKGFSSQDKQRKLLHKELANCKRSNSSVHSLFS